MNATRFLTVAAVLIGLAATTHARTVDVRMTTFGAQIRAADLIAVGSFDEATMPRSELGDAFRFRIEALIAGASGLTEVVVRVATGADRPPLDSRVLVFLARESAVEDEFRLGLERFSVVALPPAGRPSARLDLVAAQAKLSADDDADRADLRALLAAAAGSEDAVVSLSAVVDLAAAEDLAAGLEPARRAALRVRFGMLAPHDGRRAWMVEVLGLARDAETAVPFVNALAGADGRELRPWIGRALRRIDDVGAARRLLDLRQDGSPRVRADATNVLGRWGRDSFRAPLESMLADGVASVREEAALALGRMSRAASFEALRDALADESEFRVRRATVWALGRLDTPESLTLVGLVARTDENPRLRRAASGFLLNPRGAAPIR